MKVKIKKEEIKTENLKNVLLKETLSDLDLAHNSLADFHWFGL